MVREKVRMTQRLQSSTILEVVISMVVVMLIFCLAMTIFANVTRSSISTKQINVQTILRDQLIKAEQQIAYTDNVLDTLEFKIGKTFKLRSESPNLMEIHLIAYDENGKRIAELQKIIVTKDD